MVWRFFNCFVCRDGDSNRVSLPRRAALISCATLLKSGGSEGGENALIELDLPAEYTCGTEGTRCWSFFDGNGM